MATKDPSSVASERIADILATRILTGQLKPGERIKQDELAAELDTSRIPVRDALRILESRGLVSLRANAGARVITLTLREMELSYEIREKLEPVLLIESLPRLTDAHFATMQATKEALERVADVDDYMVLSRRFHWTAFAGHDAPLLAQIVERLWDTTNAYRRAYAKIALADEDRTQVMCEERDLLFRAILRRDADLGPRILATHIRRTRLGLVESGERLEI